MDRFLVDRRNHTITRRANCSSSNKTRYIIYPIQIRQRWRWRRRLRRCPITSRSPRPGPGPVDGGTGYRITADARVPPHRPSFFYRLCCWYKVCARRKENSRRNTTPCTVLTRSSLAIVAPLTLMLSGSVQISFLTLIRWGDVLFADVAMTRSIHVVPIRQVSYLRRGNLICFSHTHTRSKRWRHLFTLFCRTRAESHAS